MRALERTGFLTKTVALARKDLRIEARGRETLPPMLAFALTVALMLAFSLAGRELRPQVQSYVMAGMLWITVLFAGLIAFARSFEVERDDGALDAVLLVPLDRSGLFVGKALPNLAFLLLVEVLVIPLFAILFQTAARLEPWALVAVVVSVDVGFVAVGTLFAAVAAQTRSKELMLPVLSLPVLVPVFIAAVELTADVFEGHGVDAVAARGWFGVLIAFDVIFSAVAALVFEFTLE